MSGRAWLAGLCISRQAGLMTLGGRGQEVYVTLLGAQNIALQPEHILQVPGEVQGQGDSNHTPSRSLLALCWDLGLPPAAHLSFY